MRQLQGRLKYEVFCNVVEFAAPNVIYEPYTKNVLTNGYNFGITYTEEVLNDFMRSWDGDCFAQACRRIEDNPSLRGLL